MTHYSLEKIVAAAKAQQIIYGGRKVGNDISNLGYTLEEVARCIAQLRPEHFQKTFMYDDTANVFDAYKIEFSPWDGKTDLIYMKLRLLENGQIHVGLGSFHL